MLSYDIWGTDSHHAAIHESEPAIIHMQIRICCSKLDDVKQLCLPWIIGAFHLLNKHILTQTYTEMHEV